MKRSEQCYLIAQMWLVGVTLSFDTRTFLTCAFVAVLNFVFARLIERDEARQPSPTPN